MNHHEMGPRKKCTFFDFSKQFDKDKNNLHSLMKIFFIELKIEGHGIFFRLKIQTGRGC